MMKTSAIVAVAFAALARAQFDSLPGCGKVCIPNMLGQWQKLGCSSANDVACLCRAENFNFGIRDCISQACPPSDQDTVRSFAGSICAAAGGASAAGVGLQTVAGADNGPSVVVATGTDAQGQTVQTTLGPAGAPIGVGSVITITSTDAQGMAFTTVSTFGAGMQTMAAGGMVITTTDTAGSPVTTTVAGTEGGAGGVVGIVIATTDSAGSSLTTTLPPSATEGMMGAGGVGVITTTDTAGSTITTTLASTDAIASAASSASEEVMSSATEEAGSASSAVESASASASASGTAAATTGAAPRATAMAGLLGLAAFAVVL